MPKQDTNTLGGISSEAVQAKTGKTWPEWLAALDAEGCQKMTHKEIVAVVNQKFGIGAWWQQMVAVGYEQGRNLRDKNQKIDGYAISANKTIGVPLSRLYTSLANTRTRNKLLAEPHTVTKSTPDKSLRIKWGDGSHVDMNLYAKGEGKSQVQIEHSKLKNAREAAKRKKFWSEKVQALKDLLEG
jgi:hypothetical protein